MQWDFLLKDMSFKAKGYRLPASFTQIILSQKPTNEVCMDPQAQAYIESVSDERRELYLRLQARLMER